MTVVSWHLQQGGNMSKIIKECQRKLGNTIESFLILPVQRIPRYVLLLKAVLKHTEKRNPDYDLVSRAMQKMEAVGNNINERRRMFEKKRAMSKRLKVLQGQIRGGIEGLVDENRYIVKEDDIIYHDKDEGGKRTRYFILFNDLFLLLEKHEKFHRKKGLVDDDYISYRLICKVYLCHVRLTNIKDGMGILGNNAINSFLIQSLKDNSVNLYLFTKTLTQKNKLIKLLAELVLKNGGKYENLGM